MNIFCFENNGITALKNGKSFLVVEPIALRIENGGSIAIVGESGSGKSMIGLSMIDLLPPNMKCLDAKLFINEEIEKKQIKKLLGKEIIYIPQNGLEYLNPSIKIKSLFKDALLRRGFNKDNYLIEAIKRLKNMQFDNPEEILEKYSFELSGGMAQKVMLAMSYSDDCQLIISDEMTNGIDEETKTFIIDSLFNTYKDVPKIIITHDLDLMEKCDRIIVLKNGKVMDNILTKGLKTTAKSPYFQAFLEARI